VARTSGPLAEAVAEAGERAIPLAGDCRDAASVALLVAGIRAQLGHAPDILVNNAGVFRIAPVHELSGEDFAETVQTNLVAPFLLVRAFLADMRARGSGHIVTLGSVADRHVFPDNAAYAASKFGVRALHEVMRAELQGSGIRASLVSPGPTDTPLWDAVDPDNRDGYPARAQMLRPESVAAAVLFALSQPATVNIDELRISHA
jgi:NADP-dependent 3-hydroxy acid dehydrogenase YdfG